MCEGREKRTSRKGRSAPLFRWFQHVAWSLGRLTGGDLSCRISAKMSWHLTARWMYSAHETKRKTKATARRARRAVCSAYRARCFVEGVDIVSGALSCSIGATTAEVTRG